MALLRFIFYLLILSSCTKKNLSNTQNNGGVSTGPAKDTGITNPSITPRGTLNILFVGNSLTYENDLPAMVAEMARLDTMKAVYKSLCYPDYSLADHLNGGNVQEEIKNGKYDFVVVQQGPSALPESQVILLDAVKTIKYLCDKAASKLCVYMVWPSKARFFDLDNVINSYTLAARETNSLLAPAGLAWKYAWAEYPQLPLYAADQFHPSGMGSVLTAMTIYAVLTQKQNLDFLKYGNTPWKSYFSESDFAILKRSAEKALR